LRGVNAELATKARKNASSIFRRAGTFADPAEFEAGLESVGRGTPSRGFASQGSATMDGIIYLVGLVVVIMAILSFLGFR
jgi:hypothetical protein